MLKVAFIGAGGRAKSAHYPNVSRLEDVQIEAVAELDEDLMSQVVEQYHIPQSFSDYHEMLDRVDPDIVYVIMKDIFMTKPALDCLNAGKHVFIEKPPGANCEEVQQLRDAAVANNVTCSVGHQRRFAAVTLEAMRRVRAGSEPTLAIGEFHKNLLNGPIPNTSTMWDDVGHVVDLVRYMVQSEVVEVTAYQDNHQTEWKNCYNALIRFANKAVGIITANRSSGGRVLSAELHGVGVGCYLKIPEQISVLEGKDGPKVLSGAEAAGLDPDTERFEYEGTLTMHRHVVESIQKGEIPNNDIRDVIHTYQLVAQIEGDR